MILLMLLLEILRRGYASFIHIRADICTSSSDRRSHNICDCGKKFSDMQDGIEEAFWQIIDQRYEAETIEDGYSGSVVFGICFSKNTCNVEKCEV